MSLESMEIIHCYLKAFRSYPIVKREEKWGQTDTDRQTTPTHREL